MPTFDINAKITVSCWTRVEADSLEEALALAKKRSVAEFNSTALRRYMKPGK